jgi:hypothetical protein
MWRWGRYLVGGTWLFDVEADPFEEHDMAATNPTVVAELVAALQKYNDSHCHGQRCVPDQDTSKRPRGSPTTVDGLKVWLPWDGNPTPSACDTNRTRGGSPTSNQGSFDHVNGLGGTTCHAYGWVSGPNFSGPSLLVQLIIDAMPYHKLQIASVPRKKAGAHGFDIPFPCSLVQSGRHIVAVAAHKTATGPVVWQEDVCIDAGKMVPCVDPARV